MSAKTQISKVDSYQNIGLFWDENDSTEFGGQEEVNFDVEIKTEKKYISLDKLLFSKIKSIAQIHGVSVETLLNLWVQEKIAKDGV
jgi:hypothetical protein